MGRGECASCGCWPGRCKTCWKTYGHGDEDKIRAKERKAIVKYIDKIKNKISIEEPGAAATVAVLNLLTLQIKDEAHWRKNES